MDYKKMAEYLMEKAWDYTSLRFGQLFANLDLSQCSTQRLNFEKRFSSTILSLKGKKINYETLLDEKFSFSSPTPKSHSIPSKIFKDIADVIGRVPMSKRNKNDHETTYIIDKTTSKPENIEALITAVNIQPINTSSVRLDTIMNYWKERAEEVSGRNLSRERHFIDTYQGTRFLIRGKPGIGKSALFNYIFSMNAQDLIKKKIIWVRVDLQSTDYMNFDLEGALIAKFLKIFCKYYLLENESDFNNDFLTDLKEYLLKKSDKDPQLELGGYNNEALVKKYIELLGAIKAEGKEESKIRKQRDTLDSGKMWVSKIYRRSHFDPSIVSKLTKLLITFIQEKKEYAYIFIFDGMDNVTIDFVQRRFFREWITSYQGTTDNNQYRYKAIYITAMRDYSFVDWYKTVENRGLENRVIEFNVIEYPLRQIIEGKCELATRRITEKDSKEMKQKIFNTLYNTLNMVYLSTGLSIDKGKREKETDDPRSLIFEDFSRITNDNFRATMRFLRLLLRSCEELIGSNAFQELSNETLLPDTKRKILSRDWKIFRLLLMGSDTMRVFKNRTRYRHNLKVFSIDEEDDPILMTINGLNRAIVPNIFNYCDLDIGKSNPEFPPVLFKLRTIHYLKKKNNFARIFEIISWYQNTFGYSYPNLRYMIREMIYDGFLNPDIKDGSIIEYEIAGRDYPVNASDLGKVVIDKLLHSSIYYEIVCDDTPIHSDVAKEMEPLSSVELSINKDFLGEYLKQKTLNVMLFWYYLDKIEKIERKNFILNHDRNGEELYESEQYEIFTPRRLNNIKGSMIAYLSNYIKTQSSQQEGKIRFVLEDWYKFFNIPEQEWIVKWS